MKKSRHQRVIEIIETREVETQEELVACLKAEGFAVTQATVSRDIRELKLTKVPGSGGRQKYAVLQRPEHHMGGKYERVLSDGLQSVAPAQNILVLKTVPGMAMAVAAALDSMKFPEVVGSIAGDDTIMVAIRAAADSEVLMKKIAELIQK